MRRKGKDNRRIWVADSETDPFELGVIPAPFIWGVYHGYDGGEYWEFTDTDSFVDFVIDRDILLYAHNGGKFDWHFISHRFEPNSELLVINGRLSRFDIGKCEFRDSYNLMPVALEQYQKQKFDYTKMLKQFRDENMEEIRHYLKSDCVNLWNMVHGFDSEYGRHITQATAGMYFWKTRLKNKVPRSDAEHYDTFKPFYYGGRVQCFDFGDLRPAKGKTYQSIDINSAYPFAMLSEHAYSLEYERIPGKPKIAIEKWGPLFFVIECNPHGCFPLRGIDGSLYFPDDGEVRKYFVTGWELLTAIDTDTVSDIKFLEYYHFDRTQNFSEYVNYFWNARKEFKAKGDKGGEFYCKIFLNSLYGKYGMDIRKHKNYTLRTKEEAAEIIAEMSDGESVQDFREWIIHVEESPTGRKKFYNLATAASITGYVRAMLWKTICSATNPVYCDTDSITAESFGSDVSLSAELGDWEIEYIYDRVVICGKKLYAMHEKGKPVNSPDAWKIASKGARLTFQELIKIAAGDRIVYKNPVPTFSMSKGRPTFVHREMKATARDIRYVPRKNDPKYEKL